MFEIIQINLKGGESMAIEVHLHFNGNCHEAVNFYSKIFDLKEPNIMTYEEAPPEANDSLTDEVKKLVMYTNLKIFGSDVMFSDATPDKPVTQGDNIFLNIEFNNLEEITSLFNQLKEGGTVLMDLQKTFFAKYYGLLVDKFGIPWQLVYETH